MVDGGDLSDLSDMGGSPPDEPVLPPSRRSGSGGLLPFAGGLLATVAVAVAVVVWWPEGDDSPARSDDATEATDLPVGSSTTVPGATGEPSATTVPATPPAPADDLFGGDLPAAIGDLVAASAGPSQAIEIAVYPEYALLAYRDPSRPENIDRRLWRSGEVGEASPNPIDDRVDADTEPELFPISGVDLTVLPRLVADAVTRYDREVQVSHVLVDRFLPFDQRVLWRVYVSPTDGRSGGGYVSYDTAGTFVKVCC